MRVIKCEHCGKATVDNGHKQNKRFCSKNCCTAHRYAIKGIATNKNPCKYNKGVVCEDYACENCGWNPLVDEKRKRAIYEKICSQPE